MTSRSSTPPLFVRFASVALIESHPFEFSAARSWKRDLGIQKSRHVSDEQRGILVLRPVIGIRIEDELRVGQVLLKNKRIHGVDDHVIASVDHQRRVGNLSEIVKRAPTRSTPFTN